MITGSYAWRRKYADSSDDKPRRQISDAKEEHFQRGNLDKPYYTTGRKDQTRAKSQLFGTQIDLLTQD